MGGIHTWGLGFDPQHQQKTRSKFKTFYNTMGKLSLRILIWVQMAHACNPNYSKDSCQEDPVWNQPQQFSRPYLKKNHHKKGLVEWLKWQSACLASMSPCIQTPVPWKSNQTKNPMLGHWGHRTFQIGVQFSPLGAPRAPKTTDE
jgi:hypothetical protein